jgi:hypothetical protein
MAVREEGHRIMYQHTHMPIPIAGDRDRRVPVLIEKLCDSVGILVKERVDGAVLFTVPDRWRRLKGREMHRETDHHYGLCLRPNEVREKSLRHIGIQGRVFPP